MWLDFCFQIYILLKKNTNTFCMWLTQPTTQCSNISVACKEIENANMCVCYHKGALLNSVQVPLGDLVWFGSHLTQTTVSFCSHILNILIRTWICLCFCLKYFAPHSNRVSFTCLGPRSCGLFVCEESLKTLTTVLLPCVWVLFYATLETCGQTKHWSSLFVTFFKNLGHVLRWEVMLVKNRQHFRLRSQSVSSGDSCCQHVCCLDKTHSSLLLLISPE